MIRNFHERLLVDDFKAQFRFYRDVLGFKPTWGNEDESYADFDTGSSSISLFSRHLMSDAVNTSSKPYSADAQDGHALIFAVDSVDDSFAVLKSKGITFENEPHDRPTWGIRVAHFRDPDGNLIEINQGL